MFAYLDITLATIVVTGQDICAFPITFLLVLGAFALAVPTFQAVITLKRQ